MGLSIWSRDGIETHTLLVKCPHCGGWPMATSPAETDFIAARSAVQVCAVRPSRGRSIAPVGKQPEPGRKANALRRVSGDAMKIRSHSESHIVELDDGSQWQIFPGDLDLTLSWKPETDLTVVVIEDE